MEQGNMDFLQIFEGISGIDVKPVIDNASKVWNNSKCKNYDGNTSGVEYELEKLINDIDSQVDTNFCKYIYLLAGQIWSLKDFDKSLKYLESYQYYLSLFRTTFSNSMNMGVVVYNFRKCNKYLYNDLSDKTITLMRPNKMNDPFDTLLYKWGESFHVTGTDKLHHIKALKKSFNYYRIRSFCANIITKCEDKSIVRNLLMWSHYADEHRGVCVQYRLNGKFLDYKDVKNKKRIFLEPVVYRKKNKIKENHFTNRVNLCSENIDAQTAFLRKCNVWKYEKEVRLISYDTSVDDDVVSEQLDNDANIEAVYFGCRCSMYHKKRIRQLLRNQPNIKFYTLGPNYKNIFKLNIDPLENT